MIRTVPAPRVEVASAREEMRDRFGRRCSRRILFADEVDVMPQSLVDLLARTRVERSGHFDPPRFS